MRPWSLKDHAGWRRVPELAFSFYFPLCPPDEFKGPDASFSPVSRPHTVGGCSGDGPGALARVHLAGDLPFVLERGGAGAGAASWGAVTACGTRLRDSRSVAACVPSALGTWLAACLERGSPARHPPTTTLPLPRPIDGSFRSSSHRPGPTGPPLRPREAGLFWFGVSNKVTPGTDIPEEDNVI